MSQAQPSTAGRCQAGAVASLLEPRLVRAPISAARYERTFGDPSQLSAGVASSDLASPTSIGINRGCNGHGTLPDGSNQGTYTSADGNRAWPSSSVTDLALIYFISSTGRSLQQLARSITNVALMVNPTGPTACRWCRERGPMTRLPPRRRAGKSCNSGGIGIAL